MPKTLLDDAYSTVIELDNGDIRQTYWCPVGDKGAGVWKTWLHRNRRPIWVSLHDPVDLDHLGPFPKEQWLKE